MNLITDTRGRKGYIALELIADTTHDVVTFAVVDGRRGFYRRTDYATLPEAHKAFDELTKAFDEEM